MWKCVCVGVELYYSCTHGWNMSFANNKKSPTEFNDYHSKRWIHYSLTALLESATLFMATELLGADCWFLPLSVGTVALSFSFFSFATMTHHSCPMWRPFINAREPRTRSLGSCPGGSDYVRTYFATYESFPVELLRLTGTGYRWATRYAGFHTYSTKRMKEVWKGKGRGGRNDMARFLEQRTRDKLFPIRAVTGWVGWTGATHWQHDGAHFRKLGVLEWIEFWVEMLALVGIKWMECLHSCLATLCDTS